MATGGDSMETQVGIQVSLPCWLYQAKEKDGTKIYAQDQRRRESWRFEEGMLPCGVKLPCCLVRDKPDAEEERMLLEFNFDTKVTRFTSDVLQLEIPADRLRYAMVLSETLCERFFSSPVHNVVLVSYRSSSTSHSAEGTYLPKIGFVLLSCADEEKLLDTMDCFWRLVHVYLSSEKVEDNMISTVLHKYQPLCMGRRQVLIEELVPAKSSSEVSETVPMDQSDPSHFSPTGEDHKGNVVQEFFFIIDQECCQLLNSPTDNDPTHSAFYYTEKGPHVVEQVIYDKVSHDITFKVTRKKYKFPNMVDTFDSVDLIEAMKKLVPVESSTYTDPQKLAQHFSSNMVLGPEDEMPGMGQLRLSMKEVDIKPRLPPPPGHRYDIGEQETETETAQLIASTMKANLEHALVVGADQEWIGLQWITVEADLEEILSLGTVVRKDFRSAGFDPDNQEHLQKCFTEAKEALLSEKYGLALGLMQGIREVFIESTITKIRSFFRDNDIVLLKKLYYQAMVGSS